MTNAHVITRCWVYYWAERARNRCTHVNISCPKRTLTVHIPCARRSKSNNWDKSIHFPSSRCLLNKEICEELRDGNCLETKQGQPRKTSVNELPTSPLASGVCFASAAGCPSGRKPWPELAAHHERRRLWDIWFIMILHHMIYLYIYNYIYI